MELIVINFELLDSPFEHALPLNTKPILTWTKASIIKVDLLNFATLQFKEVLTTLSSYSTFIYVNV